MGCSLNNSSLPALASLKTRPRPKREASPGLKRVRPAREPAVGVVKKTVERMRRAREAPTKRRDDSGRYIFEELVEVREFVCTDSNIAQLWSRRGLNSG